MNFSPEDLKKASQMLDGLSDEQIRQMMKNTGKILKLGMNVDPTLLRNTSKNMGNMNPNMFNNF